MQALVVISVTSPPDWTHVVGTTGNGFQYVTDQAHGGGSSGDGRINGGRRREAVEASSNATAHGGGGSGDGLLLRLPSCSEPLYGAPPAAQGFFTSGAADAVPSAGDAPQPRASPDTYPHPYLRPVPDPEMADYRSRVESYLASPAFQSRVRQLRALGPGSDGGAASGGASSGAGSGERYPDGSGDASRGSGSGGGEGCEGCAPEGILISAGGPRLLTNVMVLLRVLRFHLNCTLPVEIAWAGPQELPGAAFRRPPKRDIPDVGSGDQVEGDTAHRGLRLHERQRDQGLHDVHVQAQQRATAEEEKEEEEEEEEPPAGDLFIGALRDAGLGPVYGLDLSRVPYPGHHRRPPKLTHWGAKVYSLLASGRFRRVLLLDADILPLADPRVALLPLLLRSPPPLPGREAAGEAALPQEPSRGFLVWSDAWRGWAGPAAYRELGLEPEAARLALNQVVGVVGNGSRRRGANDGGDGGGADDGGWSGRWGRRDAESGAVLIDRVAHADVLEYLWWINSFGDRLYHRLLHGDKDTFALAFAAAGKAHCYSQVALPPGGVFQWGRGVLEIKSPPPPAGDAVVADGGATASGPADPPPPPPAPADGWQLVGFTQHHPLNGQPLLLHRTMDKWPPLKPPPMMMTMTTPKSTQPQPQAEGGWLDVAERGWPVQVLTGPLPTRWCEYHLAHDNRGPTKGVSWQHVVPEAAIRLVPHPAYGSKTTTATTTTAAATRPANTSHPAAAAGLVATAAAGAPSSEIPSTTPPAAAAALCDVQRYTEILRGAAAGLPTAGSAAVEGLHAACARQLRSSLMESRRGTAPHGGGRHAAIAAAAAAAMSPPWGIRDRQVAVALAEALMQVPYSLPSWPSLHAALLHDGMTEAQLERPYWPPVLQPQQHPSAWPPPPSPLLGLAAAQVAAKAMKAVPAAATADDSGKAVGSVLTVVSRKFGAG
ncbi:hypothetical protein PLESTM_000631900 [Pleodorina starrii]|nr:hypothetical protein PLESTM_000631900 [Pleodorina starrii]